MLESIWTHFNRPCGKLSAPSLRHNIDLIRLKTTYHMPDTTALKLKKISPRTIDRLLHKTKQQLKIRETAGAKPLHRAVPILTWLHYAQKPSGFFQIDLVLHDGGNPSAEFCYTLTMTDVKTGGTIHSDLLNQALNRAVRCSPGVSRVSIPTSAGVYQQTRRPPAPRGGLLPETACP